MAKTPHVYVSPSVRNVVSKGRLGLADLISTHRDDDSRKITLFNELLMVILEFCNEIS